MEASGFMDVESHGMSGNLLFNARGNDQQSLEQCITSEFSTPAMVRTASQLARLLTKSKLSTKPACGAPSATFHHQEQLVSFHNHFPAELFCCSG
jgi:uncharacterized protein (DUF1697 family)